MQRKVLWQHNLIETAHDTHNTYEYNCSCDVLYTLYYLIVFILYSLLYMYVQYFKDLMFKSLMIVMTQIIYKDPTASRVFDFMSRRSRPLKLLQRRSTSRFQWTCSAILARLACRAVQLAVLASEPRLLLGRCRCRR